MTRGTLTRGQRTRDIRVSDGRFSTRDASSGTPAFDPLTLTWDRYYDYSDASSVTLNGSNISQINDLSGNAVPMVQGTALNQPLYDLAAQNGLNVGTFDGAGDVLSTASNYTRAQPFMSFVVAKFSGSGAGAQANVFSAGGLVGVLYKAPSSATWRMYSGTAFSTGMSVDGSWHVLCACFNGASSYLVVDGVQSSLGNSGAAGASSAPVANSSAGGEKFPGSVGMSAFGPVQSDTDRDAMIAFLMDKWL